MDNDRRNHPRHAIDFEVAYAVYGGYQRAWVVDVSEGGLCLQLPSDETLTQGTDLTLVPRDLAGLLVQELHTEVVRTSATQPTGDTIGVRLIGGADVRVSNLVRYLPALELEHVANAADYAPRHLSSPHFRIRTRTGRPQEALHGPTKRFLAA